MNMAIFNKMSFLPVIGLLLGLVKCSEATSEKSAIIALSIFIVIPALFLLTCCCSLIFVCHYRHKIPIFKSFVANAKKGAGTGKAPPAAAAPPPHAPGNPMPPPAYGATTPTAPPAGNPAAPPGGKPPGSYEMDKPVEVDDVVIPVKKE